MKKKLIFTISIIAFAIFAISYNISKSSTKHENKLIIKNSEALAGTVCDDCGVQFASTCRWIGCCVQCLGYKPKEEQ